MMKILTNIRFYKLAGIAQALSSLSSYVKKRENSKKLELVGVEMVKTDNHAPIKIDERSENNFRVITTSMPHPDIKELVKNADDIGKVRNDLKPIINRYKEIIRGKNRTQYCSTELIIFPGVYCWRRGTR